MYAGVFSLLSSLAFYFGPLKDSKKRVGHLVFEIGINWVVRALSPTTF